MWQAWVLAIIGLWIIIAPYLGMTEGALRVTLLITGIITIIIALTGALMRPTRMP